MTITQRKIIHAHGRATISDHQRRMQDAEIVNDFYVIGLFVLIAVTAVLNVCGVI